jgi:hypothetical protein
MADPLPHVRLDHIAFGARSLASVTELLVGELGGRPRAGGRGKGGSFYGAQWSFPGGGKVEVLEPAGPAGGFMHRFIDARGPGLHHMTFIVPDIHRGRERAEALGYAIVGFDDSHPRWKEAFIHPKSGPGVVVQMAQFDPSAPGEGWRADWTFPPSPPPKEPPARIVGPRFTLGRLDDARRLFEGLLGGQPADTQDGALTFTWERSPIRIAAQQDATRPDGPLHIEVACDRPLALPEAPHPALGLPFVQRPG